MIKTSATHVFRLEEVRVWLAEHGLDVNSITGATIRLSRPSREDLIAAWVDVVFYKGDHRGDHYFDAGDDAARGQASVPLRSLPALHAADEVVAELKAAG